MEINVFHIEWPIHKKLNSSVFTAINYYSKNLKISLSTYKTETVLTQQHDSLLLNCIINYNSTFCRKLIYTI